MFIVIATKCYKNGNIKQSMFSGIKKIIDKSDDSGEVLSVSISNGYDEIVFRSNNKYETNIESFLENGSKIGMTRTIQNKEK